MRRDWGSGQRVSPHTPMARPLLRSLAALTTIPGVQRIERDTPPWAARTQGYTGDVVLGRSRRVWGQGTTEGGVRSRLAAWHPHTTCPRGSEYSRREEKKISDLRYHRRPSRVPEARSELRGPNRSKSPNVEGCVSLLPTPRGVRRAPQACAPLSAPWPHLRTFLSLFIFLTLSASLPSSILFP